MASSTSSSKQQSEQKKSWWFWLIPLVSLLLFEMSVRLVVSSDSEEKTNRIVLMNLLEKEATPCAIMVGSSTFFTSLDDHQPSLYNLGLAGANAFTGLEILKREKIFPKYLYVEMGINSLLQCSGLQLATIAILDNKSGALFRRKHMHASRKEYNLHAVLRRWVNTHLAGKKMKGNQVISEAWKERALKQYINRQNVRYKNSYYTSKSASRLLKEEKELIDFFVSKGVKVYLVRTPEEPEMNKTRQEEYRTEEIVFPKDQYEWMDLNLIDEKFLTTDGYHLVGSSSARAIDCMLELSDYKTVKK